MKDFGACLSNAIESIDLFYDSLRAPIDLHDVEDWATDIHYVFP